MGFEKDWPRMNCMPEWFTVEPDETRKYTVRDIDAKTTRIVSGKTLSQGLTVSVKPNKPLRLIVQPPCPSTGKSE